jgi:hypothetical protein
MDHYEELGIDRSASVAEIRQAYRRLMRLLHPDHAGDEACRRLAELQTKRLNSLLAVLTDPVERERYDHQLSVDRAVLTLPAPHRTRLAHAPAWSWPVVGTAVVLSLISMMFGPQRGSPAVEGPAPPAPVAAPAPQPKKPAATPARPYMRAAAIPQAVESANRETAETPFVAAPRPLEKPPEAGLSRNDWETPELIEPAAGDPPRLLTRSALAGEWLYVPQPNTPGSGLYPPEFIELRVTEDGGLVRGRYRARYRITDRAISPTVTFEFQGQAVENGACLPWIGPGGAHGEVTLRLLTARALEVTWVVSHLGSEMGLISGTATLVRKIE